MNEGGAPPSYGQAQPQPVQMQAQPQQVVYAQSPQQQQQVVYTQQPQQQVVYVQQQPNTANIVVQTNFRNHSFPSNPTTVMCPNCKQNVQTKVELQNGLATWAVAGGLCLMGCWLGCCCIPFCVEDLKDAYHSCSQCGTHIGARKLMS
eukprot:539422_1